MSGRIQTILDFRLGQRVANRWMAARGPDGPDGIARLGPRECVGGMWDEVGQLQFDFLVGQGLQPTDVLVDIACGSLRAGVRLIPYLDEGNYLGIEKEALLIDHGRREELPCEVEKAKRPEFVVSDSFEFAKFSRPAGWAVAQSLFSHLAPEPIRLCFTNLHAWATPGTRFFATFLECDRDHPNPNRSHAQLGFRYTKTAMEAFGTGSGWSFRYIGDWGHPRGQVMAEYRKS
jgi:hypothetical protein